ncbi:hypothetical protein BsWGS_03814 [Bradybaena similaris]
MTFNSHTMELSFRRFILQCRWRTNHGECVGCGEPVRHGGVLCSLCQFFRYCSPECLKKDRLKHKPVCENHNFSKANYAYATDYAQMAATDLLYRAKLLDSEGNFISPSVLQDVYMVKSSSRFSKAIANLVDECKSDADFVSNSESTDDVVSNKEYALISNIESSTTACAKHRQATEGSSHDRLLLNNLASHQQSVDSRPSTSNDVEAEPRVRQHSELTIVSSDVDNSTAVDRLSNCENHFAIDSPNSSFSHSSSISSSSSNQTNISESFGLGWWGIASKACSKKPTLGNKSSKLLNNNKSHKMENGCQQKSHNCKTNSPTERGFPGSTETRERSESQTFGAGWWQGHIARTDSRTTKNEVKRNSQTAQSSSKTRQRVQSNHQRTSNKTEFSAGTSSEHSTGMNGECSTGTSSELSTGTSSDLSSRTSKNCGLDKKCLDDSDSSKTTSNNCASGSNASTISSHTNTSPGNDASKARPNRKEPDPDTFGSGWWKHPSKKHNTGSGSSTKSTTEKAPIKVRKPKIEEEQRKLGDENYGPENACTDVIPFEIFITPEHILRFGRVASRILSSLVQREAVQGRVIVMGLISVPGLWRASLGGSRVSLVVEIIMRLPGQIPGVIVHDNLGHIAPVIFNSSDSTTYTVPGTRGLIAMPISECLKPGIFVLLRAVKWEDALNGNLCIVMNDMRYVDFIFYDLIW